MRLLFVIIFFGVPVLTLLWWAWADRRLRGLGPATRPPQRPAGGGWRVLLAGFVLLFLLGYVWLVAGRMGPDTLAALGLTRMPHPWLMSLLMLWALLVLPLGALPSMLAWAGWRAVHRIRHGGYGLRSRGLGSSAVKPPDPPPPPDADLSRRQLLAGTLVTAPLVTAPAWATMGLTGVGLAQKRQFRVRELVVDVPGLPPELEGLTIAHVSDTHVGKFTRGAVLERISDATNELAADLVLLTGDLIDNSVYDLPEALKMIDRLDRRSGLFMVEGNHDLFDGRWAFVRGVRAAGVPLLLDESQLVQVRGYPVQVLGAMWPGDRRPMAAHVDRVAAQRDRQAFPILLAHHPHAFDRAAQLGLPLTLAGHTHGGQLMLTSEVGAGPAMFKYWSGLYQQGASRLVVSNGAGNWFPLRTKAPAEILHLTLKRG